MIPPERLRVGTAGWSYADWEGPVYPRPRPRGTAFHPLEFLASYFDCVELNSSFYAQPDPVHASRWAGLVHDRPRFRFLAKLLQAFTHGEPLDAASFERERAAYLRGLEPLGERLAAVLVQFPHSFRDSGAARARLARIAESIDLAPLVLEVRHTSWFTQEATAWLARTGYCRAAIDLPHAADHPPADAATVGPIGYLRLHGRNADTWFDGRAGRDQRYDYLYDRDEIDGLVQRARRIAGESDETYVVTNNHFSGKAVANAFDIVHGLSGEDLDMPAQLVERFPHLADFAKPASQGTLF